MFVGKKTFLHELSEFAFPILFPLLLYQRADNNSQAVGIDTRLPAAAAAAEDTAGLFAKSCTVVSAVTHTSDFP